MAIGEIVCRIYMLMTRIGVVTVVRQEVVMAARAIIVREVQIAQLIAMMSEGRRIMDGVLDTGIVLHTLMNHVRVRIWMIREFEELFVRQSRNVGNVPGSVIEVGHLTQIRRRRIVGGDHEEIAAAPGIQELLQGIVSQCLPGARITHLDEDMLRIARVDPGHNNGVVSTCVNPEQLS